MSGAASRGLRTRRPAMPCARSRAQPSARSRCARNVTRGAARSPRAMKPASLYLTIIVRRSSRTRSTMPMANSAARFTTGAHFCRARCTRTASRAATAMTPQRKVARGGQCSSAPPVTCQPNTTRRRTTTTSRQCRRRVRRLPHADRLPTWSRSAPRSQPARAAAGSVRQIRHAERLQRLSHQSRCALGGEAGEQLVRARPAGLSTLRRGVFRRKCGCARCAGATARDRRRCQPSRHCPRHGARSNQCFRHYARSKHLPRACAIRIPLLRLGALQSLANAPLDARVSLAAPLLSDPLKALRIEAASLLAAVPADN